MVVEAQVEEEKVAETPESVAAEKKHFDDLDHGIADEDIGHITAKPLPLPASAAHQNKSSGVGGDPESNV